MYFVLPFDGFHQTYFHHSLYKEEEKEDSISFG
jgi:hypothetical protein